MNGEVMFGVDEYSTTTVKSRMRVLDVIGEWKKNEAQGDGQTLAVVYG